MAALPSSAAHRALLIQVRHYGILLAWQRPATNQSELALRQANKLYLVNL